MERFKKSRSGTLHRLERQSFSGRLHRAAQQFFRRTSFPSGPCPIRFGGERLFGERQRALCGEFLIPFAAKPSRANFVHRRDFA
jgi:hypothetical protein